MGFVAGFSDGTYDNVVPNSNGAHFGKISRFILATLGSVAVTILTTADADLKGFFGGFTDGTYSCVVPTNNGARVGRDGAVQQRIGLGLDKDRCGFEGVQRRLHGLHLRSCRAVQ